MIQTGKGPKGFIVSPSKGDYPMSVRRICVEPGQRVKEGDCIAELLEPSGRWVSLVVASCNGQIKAIRARDGDVVERPTKLCDILPERRPAALEGTALSVCSRMSLEDLLTREAHELAQAAKSAPARPFEIGKTGAHRRNGAHDRPKLGPLKLSLAVAAGIGLLAGGAGLGTLGYQSVMQQPEVSMDMLWSEMRASRIAAAEAFNADVDDDLSSRAASQRRADSAAQRHGSKSTACNGLHIGAQLPGVHVTRGVRNVTYLDPSRGVGAFVWSKTQDSEAFACAAITRR